MKRRCCMSSQHDHSKTRSVFAQQGYYVVAINPTGSSTFGQAFTDAIAGDWGGRPFIDLAKGWAYVLEHYPEVWVSAARRIARLPVIFHP